VVVVGRRDALDAAPRRVLGVHHVATLTRERYEAVVERLTNGRDRLQSVCDGGVGRGRL
jgi:hypothetical protein